MSDFILINNLDISLILVAFFVAWISQTKAAAITAAEFFVYSFTMNLILLFQVYTPFLWLIFALICYVSCRLHIICTSHPLIVTSFFIPMLYNLAMFYDWGAAQWVTGEYWYIDEYHAEVMSVIVTLQLISTGVYGGFKNGFTRIVRNINNSDSPYLRAVGGYR